MDFTLLSNNNLHEIEPYDDEERRPNYDDDYNID